MKIKAIFIIAGHSIYNPSAQFNGLSERTLVIKLANALNGKLQGKIKTYIIGIDDVSINGKIDVVNKICKEKGYTVDNSLLTSLHCNSGKAEVGTGIETLGYKGFKNYEEVAKTILENMVKTTGLKNRGTKDRFMTSGNPIGIIKNTIPTAMIIENGFINTQTDRKVLTSDLYSFSTGIYNGLKKYIGFEDDNESEELKKENIRLKKKLKNINKMSLPE